MRRVIVCENLLIKEAHSCFDLAYFDLNIFYGHWLKFCESEPSTKEEQFLTIRKISCSLKVEESESRKKHKFSQFMLISR